MHITEEYRDINVKISDLGNACWIDRHFATEIQSRAFRSTEATIGAPYDESTDIWSAACLFYQVVTGQYLFNPVDSGRFGPGSELGFGDGTPFIANALIPRPFGRNCGVARAAPL
jgi:serine/threonine protein kinase